MLTEYKALRAHFTYQPGHCFVRKGGSEANALTKSRRSDSRVLHKECHPWQPVPASAPGHCFAYWMLYPHQQVQGGGALPRPELSYQGGENMKQRRRKQARGLCSNPAPTPVRDQPALTLHELLLKIYLCPSA